MQGRKIVFRAKKAQSSSKQTATSSERTGNSDRSTAHASQSLKTTAAGKRPRPGDLHSTQPNPKTVFRLVKRSEAPLFPTVSEISRFNEGSFKEVGQLKAKGFPEEFRTVEKQSDVQGDVFALVSEQRSAPSTPLRKTKSFEKKTDQEERPKHDAFDEAIDALLIVALELRTLTKDFLPERDSPKLEEKLQEYMALLRTLEGMTKEKVDPESDRGKRERQEVPLEMWNATNEGVHPDEFLLQQSETLLKLAEKNMESARVIDSFLQVGEKLTKKAVGADSQGGQEASTGD